MTITLTECLSLSLPLSLSLSHHPTQADSVPDDILKFPADCLQLRIQSFLCLPGEMKSNHATVYRGIGFVELE